MKNTLITATTLGLLLAGSALYAGDDKAIGGILVKKLKHPMNHQA